MKQKTKGLSMNNFLLMMGLLPLLVGVIVTAAFSVSTLKKNTLEEMEGRLQAVCQCVCEYFEDNWSLAVATGLYRPKDESFVDTVQDQGVEITVFNGDTRYLSSLRNSDGSRVSGTKASDEVIATVLNSGKDYSAENVVINGEKYLVYYMPIRVDGEIAGMAFAGEKQSAVDNAISSVLRSIIIIAIIIVVICVVLVYFIAQIVRKPLGEVAAAVDEIAGGNLNVDVNPKTHIVETINLINSTSKLKLELGNLVGGIKSEVDTLTGNSNSLLTTVTQSTEAVNQVSAAINEVAQGNTDLAGSVSNQMASVEELGANIDEVNNEVISMQELTGQVVAVSERASVTMDELIAINNQTKENIDAISVQAANNLKAAEQINNIVDAIESITEQTNLLSLNASIEAARAGEAGKGFAVVAGNISSLASQSANETKNIQNIVAELLQEIAKTGEISDALVSSANHQIEKLDNTKAAFDNVITQINDIGRNTAVVYDNMNNITEVKNSVSDITESLSAVSEQTSASAQEVSASAHIVNDNMLNLEEMSNKLNTSAKKLEELASYFKN